MAELFADKPDCLEVRQATCVWDKFEMKVKSSWSYFWNQFNRLLTSLMLDGEERKGKSETRRFKKKKKATFLLSREIVHIKNQLLVKVKQ